MQSIAGAVEGGRLAASLDVMSLVLQAGLIVKLVLVLLAAFSVISWALIVFKWRELARAEQDSETFLEIYHSGSIREAYDSASDLDDSPLAALFLAGCEEVQRRSPSGAELSDGDLRPLRKRLVWAAAREVQHLERGLPFLATTGSATPFIGLFGTVVGIIQAFQGIGAAGSASLAVVAPGIAEALVATAVGLVAAIPATIFYNHFAARVESLADSVDRFRDEAEEDLARAARGGRPAPAPAPIQRAGG